MSASSAPVANPRPDPAGTSAPNCWHCRHFAISWDPRMPYRCRRFGIITRILPALEVLRADGRPCQGAEPRV